MEPFSGGSSFEAFRARLDALRQEIAHMNNEYVLKASTAEVEAHFIAKGIYLPLILHVDKAAIEGNTATEVDVTRDFNRVGFRDGRPLKVPGTKVTIAVPFDGDPSLWNIRASTFSLSGFPDIDVLTDRIRFAAAFPDDAIDPDALKSRIERDLQALDAAIGYLAVDVANHNAAVLQMVPTALERKRDNALAATNAVAALGIPMKRVDQAPTFALPLHRRPSPVQLPPVPPEKYEPDPALDEDEYAHILAVMRGMSLAIERNPTSFSTLGEETIRDLFLVQLNGHYQGGATGETFNAHGKTDILIRSGDRNAFIAECKFWGGPKHFDAAITQLLGYLSWRDTKAALVVFNKTRDSVAVRRKMHEVLVARPEVKKSPGDVVSGDARYVLVKPEEPGRQIHLTTQLYDVPSSDQIDQVGGN